MSRWRWKGRHKQSRAGHASRLAAFKSSTPAVRKGCRALGGAPASPVEDHPQGPAASFSAKRIG
jgi:hypothetical protein